MLRTAVMHVETRSGARYKSLSSRFSAKYTYNGKTLIVESEENDNRMTDFIQNEDFENRVFCPDDQWIIDIVSLVDPDRVGFIIRMIENPNTEWTNGGERTYTIYSIMLLNPSMGCYFFRSKGMLALYESKGATEEDRYKLNILLDVVYEISKCRIDKKKSAFPLGSIAYKISTFFNGVSQEIIDYVSGLIPQYWAIDINDIAAFSSDGSPNVLDIAKSISVDNLVILRALMQITGKDPYNIDNRYDDPGFPQIKEMFVSKAPMAFKNLNDSFAVLAKQCLAEVDA